jgi:hypothetical protein
LQTPLQRVPAAAAEVTITPAMATITIVLTAM